MRRLPIATLCVIALLGLLAPFLANDIPLVARVDGKLGFPSLRAMFGAEPIGPGGVPWKQWWLALDEDAADFAVMPPFATGPLEVHADAILGKPSRAHPFGLDDAGRDQFTRLLHGARTACVVAFCAAFFATMIGVTIGGVSGLCGGVIDLLLLRVIEFFASFPILVAALAGAAFFGGSLMTVIALLALVQWTQIARIVRGELLSLRERPFVRCARGLGVGWISLLWRHLMPQLRGPVFVCAVFLAADAIQVESTLSFLGLGAGPATVSWGSMLDQGRTHALGGAWHLWLFPALALAITVLALHALADRFAAETRAGSR